VSKANEYKFFRIELGNGMVLVISAEQPVSEEEILKDFVHVHGMSQHEFEELKEKAEELPSQRTPTYFG